MFLISDIIKRVFFPDDYGCIVCGRRGLHRKEHGNAVLCDKCFATVKRVGDVVCTKCGRRIGSADSLCESCAKHDMRFDLAASVYCYEGAARTLVHRLKYSGAQWIADIGAKQMAEAYDEEAMPADVITFVPMYPKKERQRGYNQARLLAEGFAKRRGKEAVPLLERIRNTTPQSELDKDERMENIENAIGVAENMKENVEGKRVLVVDDILTTGSSLDECARALKEQGAAAVYGLCLCSVSEKYE